MTDTPKPPDRVDVKYPAGATIAVRNGESFQAAVKRVLHGHPEADWQNTIIATARQFGWRVYHTWNSEHSESGFPDLCMVKGRRCLMVECKTVANRLTKEQSRWLLALSHVPGIECFYWDPTDGDEMERTLSAEPGIQ